MLAPSAGASTISRSTASTRSTARHQHAAPGHCARSCRRLRATTSQQAHAHATQQYETVKDFMTAGRPVYTCTPDDTVEKALEMLVEYQISGLPVVDADGRVVGVVSDFDLLALENFGRTSKNLFPQTDETWQAFKSVQRLVTKGTGKLVRDVMTTPALSVRESTNINDATRLLLQKRIRRLPVVDANGNILGMLSRANIIAVALKLRKAAPASGDAN